ncbi:MAG TPA: hydrogen peroxide-inducible genes activator [Vitreimonas sp.]|uniref:hydrogen peroxide-inducible genes activator n=1 Tax=Vitreimonas sp. TaxID=3069702 RepID=UPI002D71C519|nr:hydrogen peroxide-inducible genes activator [Vitreimonas sp.]HYD88478.1 hydrogen peroxide-inducible genes activator [Vitreimonas sp.]
MSDRIPASSMPTLRQLQFLTALRAEGSFVAAAEAVGVTQPTLSAGIKDLETALGTVLVERGRAGAVLTPAGEEAVDRAARALSEVEELVRAAQGAGEPLSSVFRLGAIPTIAPFLLPKALPLLKQKFPKLRLLMREDLTNRLIDQLRMRTLDAAIIALPYQAAGIATTTIAEDEFLLLTPDDHPLAKRNDLSPEHLKNEELLLLEDGHCLREHALSACKLPASRRSAEVGATSLHTLVQMVAGGMGVTLLPKLAAEGGAAAGAHVAMRPFAEPVVGRAIGIAWRDGGPREQEAKLLADVLRELF